VSELWAAGGDGRDGDGDLPVRPVVPSVYGYAPRIYAYGPGVRLVWCRARREASGDEVLFGFAPDARVSEAEDGGVMASPKKRARLESGEPRHPWKENPELSSRPPFEEGNEASLVHGAHSPRRLEPLARQLEEELAVTAPWTQRPAFRASVQAWSVAEAACVLYRAHFEEHGLWEGDAPAAGLVRWHRMEAHAAALRSKLALDPNALAGLLLKLSGVAAAGGDSQGLAAVKAEGQAIVAAREQQLERVENEDEQEGDVDG
jgi:hypothetical protein